MSRLATQISITVSFLALMLAWSLAAYYLKPGDEEGLVLLPGPGAVLSNLYVMLTEERFLKDIFQSITRIFLGMLVSSICAFVIGIWFGLSPRIYTVATPLFSFAKYVPPVSFIPILILWLGIGLGQQIALLFIGTFFYLTVMVAETVAATPVAYYQAARSLGARRGQLIWKVLLPHSAPDFIQHLRTMMGIAWTYLTVVEMVATQDGIGRVIINSQRYLQTGKVLAGVFTIGMLGVLSDALLKGLGRLICRWKA